MVSKKSIAGVLLKYVFIIYFTLPYDVLVHKN